MKMHFRKFLLLLCMVILISIPSSFSNAENNKNMQHSQGMHGSRFIKKNFHDFMKQEFQIFMRKSEATRKDLAVAVMEFRTLLSQDSPGQNEVRKVYRRIIENKTKLMQMVEFRGLPHQALKKALGPLFDSFMMNHMMGNGKNMKMSGNDKMKYGKGNSTEK